MTDKLYKLLYKYAKNVSVNPTDIDDIVQEALKMILEYPPKGHLTKAFYYEVIKRAYYQLIYGTEQRTWENKYENNEEVILIHPDDYNLENVFYLKELKNNLRNSRKFAMLTPNQKKVINLRLDNWGEVPEIAETLGMNLNLAHTHNQMAIKKLKG